jgi:hypothetical protein
MVPMRSAGGQVSFDSDGGLADKLSHVVDCRSGRNRCIRARSGSVATATSRRVFSERSTGLTAVLDSKQRMGDEEEKGATSESDRVCTRRAQANIRQQLGANSLDDVSEGGSIASSSPRRR